MQALKKQRRYLEVKQEKSEFKYIYGPVASWRLGFSLGLDLISTKKACTFNCAYCQVGPTLKYPKKRRVFVPTKSVISELKRFKSSFPSLFKKIDYVTFSGMGEPTLAKNLGTVLREIKKNKINKPTAILTNSCWVDAQAVRKELKLADFVIAKLDAHMPPLMAKINKPAKETTFSSILVSLKKFRAEYKKRFALQIMFTQENKSDAEQIAILAKTIKPNEIQLNTPLRPCGVKPLSKTEMEEISSFFSFKNIDVVSVYEAEVKKLTPTITKGTLRRRGKVV